MYGIHSRETVYRWIYKYSRSLEKGTVLIVEKDSMSKKMSDLERRNKELEAALGRKQMELDFYKTMIELAEERQPLRDPRCGLVSRWIRAQPVRFRPRSTHPPRPIQSPHTMSVGRVAGT